MWCANQRHKMWNLCPGYANPHNVFATHCLDMRMLIDILYIHVVLNITITSWGWPVICMQVKPITVQAGNSKIFA